MVLGFPGLTAVVCLCGVASAQQFVDTFDHPKGTRIPGYTEVVGDWQALGAEIQCQSGRPRQVLLRDGLVDKDACIEVTAIYDTAQPGPQHAGVLLRYEGSGRSATFYYVSLSDRKAPYRGWDYYAIRCQGHASNILKGALLPNSLRARIRLQVSEHPSGVRTELQVDSDLDGRLDVNDSRVTFWGRGSGAGRVGLFGGNGAKFDDLRFFDANLYVRGIAKVGTSLDLVGRVRPGLDYLGAFSLGRTGFPIGGGRRIPLDADPVFRFSLADRVVFQAFSGTTGSGGDFVMKLNIPPNPSLHFVTGWTSAVSLSGSSIVEIAPDQQITFVGI